MFDNYFDEIEIFEQCGGDAFSTLDEEDDLKGIREKYYWRTQDGVYIPVDKLEDSHIINIVFKFGKDRLERTGHCLVVEKFNKIRKERGF